MQQVFSKLKLKICPTSLFPHPPNRNDAIGNGFRLGHGCDANCIVPAKSAGLRTALMPSSKLVRPFLIPVAKPVEKNVSPICTDGIIGKRTAPAGHRRVAALPAGLP